MSLDLLAALGGVEVWGAQARGGAVGAVGAVGPTQEYGHRERWSFPLVPSARHTCYR